MIAQDLLRKEHTLEVNKSNYSIDCFHNAPLTAGVFKSNGIERRRHLWESLLQVDAFGHIMEFGVYKGKTMKHIAKMFPNKICWGFDSFEGLPEPWYTNSSDKEASHPAGRFHWNELEDKPEFADNVKLVAGWFNETLPQWIFENPGPVCFLHIDCDLYSSTSTVLELLNDWIVPGTVIVFDEMYPWGDYNLYDLWADGEYKALGEWLEKYDRAFVPLNHSRHQQCSLRVTK